VADEKWKPVASQPTGLCFHHRHRSRDGPRSLNRMLTVPCWDAKVRRARVHDLRHTCASVLLAQGVDARTIMETLGHSTITMTLDIYAHVMHTTPRAAADRMDEEEDTSTPGEGPGTPCGTALMSAVDVRSPPG